MIHNPQQLLKELFALKIIDIVVLEFVLYCDYHPRSTVFFAILNRLSTGQITLY